jgi:hypothetical protein
MTTTPIKSHRNGVRIKTFLSLLVVLTFSVPGSVSARLAESWSYEEMFSKADFVVIARRIATEDASERTTLSDTKPVINVIGILTKFESLLVLKGGKDVKEFRLHHYRFESEVSKSLVDAPNLVEFSWEHPTYLLFLMKELDGMYVPVSGQTDAGAYAVLELKGDAH